MYYPPGVTADGQGVVSRNFDYGLGTYLDESPEPAELPDSSRPYVVELHPDRGYSSVALCTFDLLSGVMDGINSAGLTVTLLASDELEAEHQSDGALDSGVGLDECQVLRLLLDTCASVEEAKEALLFTKQYYIFQPSHFLIADRHGESFVWEYSHAHNREHIVESPGRPLISTNFRLHQHLDGENPPSAEQAKGVCGRYAVLAEAIAAERGKLTEDIIGNTHKAVDMVLPGVLYRRQDTDPHAVACVVFPRTADGARQLLPGGGTGPERLRPRRASGASRAAAHWGGAPRARGRYEGTPHPAFGVLGVRARGPDVGPTSPLWPGCPLMLSLCLSVRIERAGRH